MIGDGERMKVLMIAGAILMVLVVLRIVQLRKETSPNSDSMYTEVQIEIAEERAPVRMELASKLVRHGRVALQADRLDIARASASRALFLSDGRIGRALEAEYEERVTDLVSQFGAEAKDLTIAGEREESLIFETRMRSISNGGGER